MSQPTAQEPVHIEPVEAPLSSRGRATPQRARAGRRRPRARSLAFGATLAILCAALAWVVVYVPDRVDPTRPSANSSPATAPTPGTAGQSRTGRTDIVAPFEAAEMAQAQERAKAQLAVFVETQLKLEQELNVASWGEAELAAINARGNAADQLFVAGDYLAALDEYAGATEDLQDLVAKGAALFDSALAEGARAIEALDHARATDAFERAGAIRTDDPRAAAGAAHAARIPKIVELLRESDRAVLRGDYGLADEFLAQVGAIDATTPGLARRTVAVAIARAIERRRSTLSEGFSALDRHDYDVAIDAFGQVLAQDPRDADALAGSQQARQAKTLAEIDRLRGVAENHEREDEWTAALLAYDQALTIDPTLQFAIDGKERIADRVALIGAMARFIDDPGLLSADTEFARARQALARAASEVGAGPKFAAQLAELRRIVDESTVPVPLVLVSDNATEVVIQKVGPIGVFARSELLLRPGRYIIMGSRDGCRDVRKEIILAEGMAPVDIRCAESI